MRHMDVPPGSPHESQPAPTLAFFFFLRGLPAITSSIEGLFRASRVLVQWPARAGGAILNKALGSRPSSSWLQDLHLYSGETWRLGCQGIERRGGRKVDRSSGGLTGKGCSCSFSRKKLSCKFRSQFHEIVDGLEALCGKPSAASRGSVGDAMGTCFRLRSAKLRADKSLHHLRTTCSPAASLRSRDGQPFPRLPLQRPRGLGVGLSPLVLSKQGSGLAFLPPPIPSPRSSPEASQGPGSGAKDVSRLAKILLGIECAARA